MRVDPNKACNKFEEVWVWAVIHDLVAHPLMALTAYSRLSLQFHDWTSHRAWLRDEKNKI